MARAMTLLWGPKWDVSKEARGRKRAPYGSRNRPFPLKTIPSVALAGRIKLH